jgi:uncharacterized protein (DUF58 family)
MATATPGARFLDPEALARIENLELLARTVVEGVTSGRHRSPYLGLSLDFAEHRAYMPGDDIRRIDWRLYARTDRYYVKQFEADTNANLLFLLDISASMNYGSGKITKLDYARFLTASLAYFCRKQGDRIGLMTFDDKVRDNIPASARHLQLLLNTLERINAGRAGGIAAPLRKLAEDLRRRSILVLVSDLYEEPDDIASALGSLAAAGHDVIVFQVMDPAELDFPFDQASNFRDVESGDRMAVIPDELADEYRKLVLAHQAELSQLLTRSRIDYRACSTAQPLDYVLFDFLSARERLTRVR